MSGGGNVPLPKGFGKLAVIVFTVNALIFLGAVAAIAVAAKWVLS